MHSCVRPCPHPLPMLATHACLLSVALAASHAAAWPECGVLTTAACLLAPADHRHQPAQPFVHHGLSWQLDLAAGLADTAHQ